MRGATIWRISESTFAGALALADKNFRQFVKAESIDAKHGLVMGWAMICKQDGVDYIDVQENHIPEDSMLDAAVDFMENSRMAKEMHRGDARGSYLFAYPLTTDIAKAMGITSKNTGLMIGYKPPPDVLAKFQDGTYTGFSIGGYHIKLDKLDEAD